MKAYITTCCKNKLLNSEEIPAIKRYISTRINTIHKTSLNEKVPFFILSGKHGLLSPLDNIKWYDKILNEDEVTSMVKIVAEQINKLSVSSIIFFTNKKWTTYNEVIKQASLINNLKIEIKYSNYSD